MAMAAPSSVCSQLRQSYLCLSAYLSRYLLVLPTLFQNLFYNILRGMKQKAAKNVMELVK